MNYTTKQLEKAFELACDYLVDAYNAQCDEPHYSKTYFYFKDGRVKYACEMTIQDWKEYFLSEVE